MSGANPVAERTPDVAAVLEAVGHGLVACDLQGRVTLVNPAACRLLGVSEHDLVGGELAAVPLVDDDGRPLPPADHPVATTLHEGREAGPVLVGVGTPARRRRLHVSSVPLRDLSTQELVGALTTWTDVGSLGLDREELRRRAFADPLTGLANRTLLEDRLAQAFARLKRRGGGAALLLLDVDRFKEVNDRAGHQGGDHVLRELGHRLAAMARAEDTVARIGGDEFAVLLEQVGSTDEAAAVARRLRLELARQYEFEGAPAAVTVSVGVAVTDDPDGDPAALYRDADVALYRAKEEGRDRYVVFDEGLRAWTAERSDWLRRVAAALAEDRLGLRRRPVVDLRTREHRGVLVVATVPAAGDAPDAELAPEVLADAGLVAEIDHWLVGRALSAAEAAGAGPVHVRLSTRTLLRPDLVDLLVGPLRARDLDPASLVVSVGERDLQEHLGAVLAALAAVRAQGVLVGLADVRGDRVPVRRLAALAFDRVTLAASLVREARHDPVARAAARAITGLYADLGAPVGAEGLDDPATVELARSLGCELGTGAALG